MMLECQTCHGTYDATLPDGLLYFHVCPPLSAGELRDGLTRGTVTLPAADRARLEAAQRADAASPVPAGQPTREDLVLSTILVERPNRRDENVTGAVDAKGRAIIKAAGAGTKIVPGRP